MGMKSIMMMAQAMAVLGGGYGFDDGPRLRNTPAKRKSVTLSGIKHIGPIPSGCTLINTNIQTRLPDFIVEVAVEIVAANNNSFNKKLVRIEHEVLAYLAQTSVKDLMEDSRIKLTPIEHEQAVEDAGLEG